MIDILDEKNWPDDIWLEAQKVIFPFKTGTDLDRVKDPKNAILFRNLIRYQLEHGYWTLPDPLEQVRKDAREICAEDAEADGWLRGAAAYRLGDNDGTDTMRCTVRALAKERGIEVSK